MYTRPTEPTLTWIDEKFAKQPQVAAANRALLRDGMAHVQAGAGIVADSDPAAEDEECQNKAAAVLRALAIAEEL